MRRTTVTCDRCGAESVGDKGGSDLFFVGKIDERFSYDLCTACKDSFVNWMTTGRSAS